MKKNIKKIFLLLPNAGYDGLAKSARLERPSRVDKKLWPFRISKFSNSYTISMYLGLRGARISKLFSKNLKKIEKKIEKISKKNVLAATLRRK